MEYWSGCNYYINQGKNEYEPLGTATSMHDCGFCEKLDKCKLKKETETWKFNKAIEKQMNYDWAEMVGSTGWESIRSR